MFDDKVILITGGTGSWGNELTRQIFGRYRPKQVRIYSRGEFAQVKMHRQFHNDDRLRFIIGDVRDYERLSNACKGVDYIFHLAALKHIPVCEENPFEAVRTNVIGTQNVIDAASQHSVRKVIDISSDKATNPLNLYGTTKSVGEKLIISANILTDETAFMCIRAGNVIGTTGSVVPLFRTQILNINAVTITDEHMTRFFLNLQQVIAMLFKAAEEAVGGEIYTLEMPSVRIGDLADVMIRDLGNEKTEKRIIGKRPGEKVHELLVSKDERERTFRHGEYLIILPMIKIGRLEQHYDLESLPPVDFEEFSSGNARRLTQEEILSMLQRENWLSKKRLPSDVLNADKDVLLDPFEQEGWTRKT